MDKEDFIGDFVYINGGRHKGRIGYCDDIDDAAFVHFGPPLMSNYKEVPIKYLSPINTEVLFNRRNEIANKINIYNTSTISENKRMSLLEEFKLIDDILMNRMVEAQFMRSHKKKKVFLSYSSQDKQFAVFLATDLSNSNHSVWIDEWDILPGQSIPHEINVGIDECNFVIVILSPSSVNSRWVQTEWHAKYWTEIAEGRIKVIPVLHQKCKIPTLLKAKKYADFTTSYEKGLNELLLAINNL